MGLLLLGRCRSISEDQVHLCHPVSVPGGACECWGGVCVLSLARGGFPSHHCLGSGQGGTAGLSWALAHCPNHRLALPFLGPLSSGMGWAVSWSWSRGGGRERECRELWPGPDSGGVSAFPFLPGAAPPSATPSTCPCPRAPWTRSCSSATAAREQRPTREGS